jgi:hypothetical protein
MLTVNAAGEELHKEIVHSMRKDIMRLLFPNLFHGFVSGYELAVIRNIL